MTNLAAPRRSEAGAQRPIAPPESRNRPSDEPVVFTARARGMHNAVWMLMLSAAAARLAAILLRGEFGPGAAGEFGSIASGLLEGSGFAFNEAAIYTQHGIYEPSSAQPPAYPLLLAGIYALLGIKTTAAHLAAMLVNALLGAATVPATYSFVRRMGTQHSVAVLGAGLLAFWPTQIFAATQIHPLVLITFLVTLSVALFYRAIDVQRVSAWAMFCLVTALLALCEPALLPALLIGLVLILAARGLPAPLRLGYACVLIACTAAVIGPWIFRNWRVHGAIEPVTGSFWASVWKGNNPQSNGTDRPTLTEAQRQRYWSAGLDDLRQFDLLTDTQRQALDGKRTAEREAIWRTWAISFIRENPGRYAQLCGIRLGRTLWADWDDPRSRDPYFLYFGTRSLLLLGTLAGLVLAVKQDWRLAWPLVLGGTIVAVCTLTVTGARSALPMEPIQIVLLSLLLVTLWQRASGTRQRPPIVRRFARDANDGASPASLGLQD